MLSDFKDTAAAMLCDYYEITMGNGYFEAGKQDTITYFDLYFRNIPDNGGYAIAAGLEQAVEYLSDLSFSENDIEYLRSRGCFSDSFLSYLRDFKFECDVWAIPEGTPVFPNEPLITVRGPAVQTQLVETALLLLINHQSLIATKASRIVRAADGRAIAEFGARRAHGTSAAIMGARAAYIGGCVSTSCTLSAKEFGIPPAGTMAHSWVQLFDSEYDAFAAYAKTYPNACVLLVDTYNVLKSGMPNAIKVFNEVLKPLGAKPIAVRIDSGDIAYLTKKIRAMLDRAGYPDCGIMVTNSLDENIIRDVLSQGAQINSMGVGERLVTSKSDPVFGGIYKLVAVEKDGTIIPKIKISENTDKITTPHFKQVYRFFSNESGKAIADVVAVRDEAIDDSKPYELFDPVHTWKRSIAENYTAQPLLVPVFEKGKLVYDLPNIQEIQNYCREQTAKFWEEVLRLDSPHNYYVDLSQKLWDIKNALLKKASDGSLGR